MKPNPTPVPPLTTVRVVAGLGCRRGCTRDELLDLLIHSLARQCVSLDQLTGLASIVHKQDEPGLQALARHLNLTLICFSPADLQPYQAASAASALVQATTGSPAVAEPCALALAARLGTRPRLLGEKNRNAGATCALAAIDLEPAA